MSGSGTGNLSLIADKDIQVNAALQNLSGEGDLTLSSKTGVAINSGGSIDWDGGSGGLISITGGLSGEGSIAINSGTLVINIADESTGTVFGGTITGNESSRLSKSGAGTLVLSGSSSYSGITSIDGGNLTITGVPNLSLIHI